MLKWHPYENAYPTLPFGHPHLALKAFIVESISFHKGLKPTADKLMKLKHKLKLSLLFLWFAVWLFSQEWRWRAISIPIVETRSVCKWRASLCKYISARYSNTANTSMYKNNHTPMVALGIYELCNVKDAMFNQKSVKGCYFYNSALFSCYCT